MWVDRTEESPDTTETNQKMSFKVFFSPQEDGLLVLNDEKRVQLISAKKHVVEEDAEVINMTKSLE